MGTALLIFLLLAVCGFIAYIGDLLGRRLGKKRLSVFGLRPKHTAILLTIVTGVVIAAVSLGTALLAVPGFRRAVLEGEKLVRQNRKLNKEQQDALRQQAMLAADNQKWIADNQKWIAQNGELSAKNSTLTAESARLTAATATLKQKNKTLSTQNNRLQTESARLQTESARLKQGNQALRAANTRLQGSNRTLTAANTRLNASNTRLQAETERLRAERKKGQAEVVALRGERDALELETAELKKEEYVYRRNEQIAYRPLPPNPPAEQIRATVKNLLYEARHPMGQPTERPLELEPPEKFTGPIRDEKAFQEWVVGKAAATRNQRLVVRLVATENAVEGRPIRARLDWYPNQLVFTRGQSIAETRVDGAGTLGTVLEELVFFLKSNVRERALAPPNPMKLREEGLGELSYDQMLAACEQARSMNGLVRVVARARQDTYQAGPLNVDLEVIRIGPSEAQRR
jgi:uncharacterized protein (DUF3084 family)